MEIRTVGPDELQDTATSRARNIPAEEIDSTFKSKYIGTPMPFLTVFLG